jgi:ferredoxin/menaquinone-dependent protoporphyrinogen IX oxidase
MINSVVRLLYFSPTGTTRRILEAIAEGLGEDKPKHIDLTSAQTRTGRRNKIRGGHTIIGAPVYTGRVALEAVRGLQRFTGTDAQAVVVVVYGNREYEDALLELKNIVMEAGFTPIAGAVFIGEHSFSTKNNPIAHGRPDRADLERARLFGTMVKKKLEKPGQTHGELPLNVPGNFPYRERGPARNISPETDDSICVRCEKCKEACPTAAITFIKNFVTTDTERCILCCGCVKSCSTGARRLNDLQLTQFAQKLSITCSRRKEPEFYL